MTNLAAAGFLATANYAIVNYLVNPIRVNYPNLKMWWAIYLSFITGMLIGYFSGINLFDEVIANELLARILTGAVIGGGSNIIHEVFGK